jgi:hypothetical protein
LLEVDLEGSPEFFVAGEEYREDRPVGGGGREGRVVMKAEVVMSEDHYGCLFAAGSEIGSRAAGVRKRDVEWGCGVGRSI